MQDAVTRHLAFESASFHTPGHKGRCAQTEHGAVFSRDVTELPGLDELYDPTGVLAELERRAAQLWHCGECIISTNGASAGLAAAMLSIAPRGSKVLVPRNAHRSVINGLVLSGLLPVWYEPKWDDDWCAWGPLPPTSAQRLLERADSDLAGLVVVSPTYAGAISDVAAIASLCKERNIPLVVDEAHGAHLLPQSGMPPSAIAAGADLVVHSLHKTLTALTQTGLVHISSQSLVPAKTVRINMGLLQSSSPSYLLMESIEQAIATLEQDGESLLKQLADLSKQIGNNLPGSFEIYQAGGLCDPAHILIRTSLAEPDELSEYLSEEGIFAEAIIGNGLLLLLGLGSTAADVSLLVESLRAFDDTVHHEAAGRGCQSLPAKRLPEPIQVLSPRQASLLPAELLPLHLCAGRIAAETVAPCPPGTALVVAGQRVPEEILETANIQKLRVVVE